MCDIDTGINTVTKQNRAVELFGKCCCKRFMLQEYWEISYVSNIEYCFGIEISGNNKN